MNGAMSADDLLNIVLAGGTGKLNKKFRSTLSSLFNHFMMDDNIHREDGDGMQYDVVVEGENVRAYKAGSIWPTNKRKILNQWHVPYMDIYAGVTFEGTDISKKLGGYSIDHFMGGTAPSSKFPTLINIMETHLSNVKESFMLNQSDALYNKKVEADRTPYIDGFDVIFAPDTEYGGIGYRDLGEHDWDSLLMVTSVYRHNPLYRDFGGNSFPTIFGHLNAACTDISRGRANISTADTPEKIKIMAVCGPGAFAKWDKLFTDQRLRGTDSESNIGIVKPITWDRWGLEIHADHYCPEDKMYIWANEHIKCIKQTGPRGDFSLRRVRLAFAQDEIHCPWTVEYNLGCSARWQCCLFDNMTTGIADAAAWQ